MAKNTKKPAKNFEVKSNINSNSTINEAQNAPAADPDEKSKTLVTDRFNRAKNYREAEQEPIWKRSYNNYRGVLDQTKFPWRSKLFIPWSFTVVETIIPKVFARDPKWRAVSSTPFFSQDGPGVIQDLLNYQWGRMGMRIKMYDYIKDSLMYSKGYAKVTWLYTTKAKTIMEPVAQPDGTVTFEKREQTDVENDDPNVDIVDPFDVYVDPDATSLDDALYIIHRKTVPLADLKANPNYKNTEKIEVSKKSGIGSANTMSPTITTETRFNNNTPSSDNSKQLVEVLEYWEDDRLIVIANQKVVMRDSPNPYAHKMKPFVELDDYRDPHRYYGQSELSVIDPLQREVNSIRNQRRDYDNLALNPVVRMVPGTLRNPNSATMGPGNVWMVTDLNSMDVFQLPQLQGASTQIENQTVQDIQRAVAVDEIGIGLMPDNAQRVAATTVVTAQSMAGKRFATKIALLEEAVKKIGQMVFALNQQFLDKERMIQIVGPQGGTEWVKFDPVDIRGQYNIGIETGSMLPKDEIAARKEAVELLQYITPIIGPMIQTNPQVVMPVIRMVLDTFDLPAKNDILNELQQALGIAKQQQDAQAAAAQAATEASAINQTQQAIAAGQAPPEVDTPETLQGARADQELERIVSAQ